MTYIGVDISKKSFVAAFPSANGYLTKEFENTPRGVRKFIGSLPNSCMVVMEATGNYCFLLLYLLHNAKIEAALVNPKQIKHFARMMMTVTKTDAKDACLIALYGEKMNPASYKLPSATILTLKQKRTVISQLNKQLNATHNLLESITVLPYADKTCLNSLKKTISFLEKQIKSLESELVNLAESEFDALLKRLTSIKGIGVTLATALIIATGGFTYFNNAKQLSRYIGICPTVCQSGSSISIHGSINRNGDESLRSMLYIASWSAIRYNASCRQMYERMRSNGKPAKVALVAVSNKLVRQCFAVANSNMSYIDGFVSTKPETQKCVSSKDQTL